MSFKITFLGTSGAQPTKERNVSGLVIEYKDKKLLLDCGEGTQRQLKHAGIAPTRITHLFLTHLHGDHCIGLAGFMRNLAMNEYKETLPVYGPKGVRGFAKNMATCTADRRQIKYKVQVVKNGVIYEDKDVSIRAQHMLHTTACYAYRIQEKPKRKMNMAYLQSIGLTQHPLLGQLQEGKTITYNGKRITPQQATILIPGKSVVYITDTYYCSAAVEIAKDADIAIMESTFTQEEEAKAKSYKHLTAKLAAQIAKEANVKKLILTHFSQRYKTTAPHVREAKEMFKDTVAANDFDIFTL